MKKLLASLWALVSITCAAQVFSFNDPAWLAQGSTYNAHFLNSLVTYWTVDGALTLPQFLSDSEDGNTAQLSGGVINVNNGPFGVNTGSYSPGAFFLNPTPSNLQLGTGKSFTGSVWIQSNGSSTDGAGVYCSTAASVAASSFKIIYSSGGPNIRMVGFCTDSSTPFFDIAPWPATGSGATGWHLIVFGYDSANKLMFGSLDGGSFVTHGTTADLNAGGGTFALGVGFGLPSVNAQVAQAGAWVNRVFNNKDAAALWNNGSGVPFSSFTP